MTAVKTLAAALLIGFVAMAQPARAQLFDRDDFRRAEIAIIAASSRAGKVAAVKKVPSVTAISLKVRVTAALGDPGDDTAALRVSAQKNAAGIARLRAALSRNPATRAALARKGIASSRIVGVEVFSSGALRVYYF